MMTNDTGIDCVRYEVARGAKLGRVRGGAVGGSWRRFRQGYAEDAQDTFGHIRGTICPRAFFVVEKVLHRLRYTYLRTLVS